MTKGVAAVFRPFAWVPSEKQDRDYDLLSRARDVSAGVSLVLQIIEENDLAEGVGDVPLFSQTMTGTLMRMAISSLDLVSTGIDEHFEWLNDRPSTSKE